MKRRNAEKIIRLKIAEAITEMNDLYLRIKAKQVLSSCANCDHKFASMEDRFKAESGMNWYGSCVMKTRAA